MSYKTLLVLGDDKISSRALSDLSIPNDCLLVKDSSTNITRVWRLLIRRRLPVTVLFKMIFSEMRRDKLTSTEAVKSIENNNQLAELIRNYKPEKVYLYRAGLIIDQEVLGLGIPLLNIHCANIPQFGGIGAIARALQQGAYQQNATLHQITKTIDDGTVIDIEPYELSSGLGYFENEERAYAAGQRLLERVLNNSK